MSQYGAAIDNAEDALAGLTAKADAGWFRNKPLVDAALAEMVSLNARARTADQAGDQVAVGHLIRQILDVMDRFEVVQRDLDG